MAPHSGRLSFYFPPADADLYAPGAAGEASRRNGTADHCRTRVAYFHDAEVGNFHFGVKHPMKPHRLTLTNHLVSRYGLMRKMEVYLPRRATEEELKAFHAEDYVDFLKRVTPENQNEFASVHKKFNVGQEEDCPIFEGMYDFCSIYAGASIEAARKLTQDGTDIAINWSGGLHHAKRSEASGFCYVNDIVLAIFELLRVYPRVLYIDIDVHHGDGVQEAFYSVDRVMTVSFHKYGGNFFPGTGDRVEIGNNKGKYYSLNVPLQDGIEDDQYVYLFREVMENVILRFRPSAIVLQCGTDSLGLDRLGVFNLSIKAHGECVRFIKNFKIPLLVLGGGGYTIRNVARCWTYETAVVLDTKLDPRIPDNAYYDYFAPDHSLHPDLRSGGRENENTKESIEQLRVAVLEHLRYLDSAPSVMMQEIPPPIDGLSSSAPREEERREDERPDRRADHPPERTIHPAEYYDESDDDGTRINNNYVHRGSK